MRMETIGPKMIVTWEPQSGEDAFVILAAYRRVHEIALLMTGSEEEATLIEAGALASAKTFLDWADGPGEMHTTPEMRERVIDRQMMIQMKAWIPFEPLGIDPQAWVKEEITQSLLDREVNQSDVRTALLLIPASERLVYVLRWVMGYSYERIDVLFNLGSPIMAREAAYVALRILREKLGEKTN